MRRTLLLLALLAGSASGAPFEIITFDREGMLTWSNAFPAGVANIQTAPAITGPWSSRKNVFTSNSVGAARAPLSASNQFVRLLAVDISTNSPRHYTNLLESYGILETVAGRGTSNSDVSQWLPSFEGEWATNVALSRPHVAFGDPHGNVLIVDQRSSSILKVTPAGRLHTY